MFDTVRSELPQHWLYPLWQWLVYLPLAVVITVTGALLAIPAALLVSPRLANQAIAMRWAQLMVWLVPARVIVHGRQWIEPGQSYVVVANHQSQFDIPVVYGFTGLDLRWVIKSELRRVPFVAQGCRAIGHIFIDRCDPEQARAAINQAVSRLQAGTGILFFPEGTRSRSGDLLRFKKGAFRVAIDRRLPVLPITLQATREVMPPDSLRIRPGTVWMTIHPPVPTDRLDLDDLGDLREQVRSTIAGQLDSLPES